MGENTALNALRSDRAKIAAAISNTEAHLSRLREKLAEIDRAIKNTEAVYAAPLELNIISRLVGENEAPGLTEAVKDIYRAAIPNSYLTPTEVRDRMKAAGSLRAGYENEMAAIHQVIRRLQDQGVIEPHPTAKVHRWIRPQSTGIVSESKSNTKPVATVTAKKRTGKDFFI